MAGSVVGQEVGKDLYGKNSTAPKFEQGVFPGLAGSAVGNSVGQALSRTLCNRLVPNLEDLLKWKSADAVARMTRSLHQGLGQLLTAHLQDLGVDTAKAVQFARQLEETIRLADRMSMIDAYDYLNRQLIGETAQLSSAIASSNAALTHPAISGLVQLAHQSLMAIPGSPSLQLPFPKAKEPVGLLQEFTDRYQRSMNWAKESVPAAQPVVEKLEKAIDGLYRGATEAADFIKHGLPDAAKNSIHKAGHAAKGLLDALFSGSPVPDSDHSDHSGGGRTQTVTVTATVTSKTTETAYTTQTQGTTSTSTAVTTATQWQVVQQYSVTTYTNYVETTRTITVKSTKTSASHCETASVTLFTVPWVCVHCD